jgi:abequosyltransferase
MQYPINRTLLTIAIPTFNRATYLDTCLRRIAEELNLLEVDKRKLVKVYISNNASTDNTATVIANYELRKTCDFESVHNSENIGAERNVVQCYKLSSSQYVWILGDDDVILPGALDEILNVLLQKNVDILYLNHYWFKKDYMKRAKNNHRNKKRKVSTYLSSLDFARRTNVMLTFISGLIVPSDIEFEDSFDILAGSYLSQLGWILPSLRDGNRFVVIEDEVIAARGANSGGYELVDVFAINLKKIMSHILKDKPEVARSINNGTIVKFFPNAIMSFRRKKSQFTDENISATLHKAYKDNWRYYVFLLPLLKLPLYLSYAYYIFVKVIVKLAGPLLIK